MKNTSTFKIAFPIASVWFAALVGPSMVSGIFATSYYTSYGVWGLILPCLTFAVACFIITMGAETVRRQKTYDYSSFSKAIYGKASRFFSPILEVYMVIAMIVSGSAVVAMGATLLHELIGAPPIVGAIGMSAICMCLVLWGESLIRKSSVVISMVMIGGLLLLAFFSIQYRAGTLADMISSGYVPEGATMSSGIRKALALGFSNSANALVLTSVEQTVTKRRHSWAIGGISFVMNVGVFVITTLLTLPYSPEVLSEQMPTLYIIHQYLAASVPWLPTVYMLTMFVALMDSSQLHAVASRTMQFYPNTGILRDNVKLKTFLTGIVYFAISILISMLGLRTIVGTGYSLLGYLAIPLIAVPVCIVAPLRRMRQKAQDWKAKDISSYTKVQDQ
ncbi:hypothetical protein U6B65_06145 [Oscillospiraceae bacterium MB08-C2-2]|nr:hypothetical protein U6B65_06145 [Oscillospiraceae bacterium MB08-C2-2]